jgi:hypothetical protein
MRFRLANLETRRRKYPAGVRPDKVPRRHAARTIVHTEAVVISTRTTARIALVLVVAAAATVPAGFARAQTAPTTQPPKAVADSVAANPGGWFGDLTLGLGLSQSAFSDNWSGGDLGAFSWLSKIDAAAERQFSYKFNLRNTLEMRYGETSQQRRDELDPTLRAWDSPQKSSDMLALESVGRWTLNAFADPYAAFRAESQFRDESSPLGTITLNPIRLKETAGIAKVFKKTEAEELISRVGVGARQTFGKSFLVGPPVTKDSFSSNDGGFEWFTTARLQMAKNRIEYKGDLLVFAPMFYSQDDALDAYDAAATALDPNHRAVADDWRVPDVNWRNGFSSKITKVIRVDLFLQLVYDKFDTAANVTEDHSFTDNDAEVKRNLRRAAQWKQTLALGIAYDVF